ncbi:MAG: 4-hydroxy-tetrahydrodipicolinate synthase [Candidatus Poribacteria bacterium]|nr:MAG: 4-hydroxy-tetrahydrodipicolinate synthase [Candidatus Poribacteria bacterium]
MSQGTFRLSRQELLRALSGVTAIPIIPFHEDGSIHWEGHRKNTEYLLRQNSLEDGLPRVIAHAGTSLIHYLSPQEQVEIVRRTGELMGDQGVLMAAVIPQDPQTTIRQIQALEALDRPPDVYLLMPVPGIATPEGVYVELRRIAEATRVRCLYYLRRSSDVAAVIRLVRETEEFLGVKVGTGLEDVPSLVRGIGQEGIVVWGKGDRATEAIQLGARGHTSGIAVLAARAADGINNAYRSGQYEQALAIQRDVEPMEEIRFAGNRELNYTAVALGMRLSGFRDIEGGAGGRYNPLPADPETVERIKKAVERLKPYH